jgi:hypothetical protein
VTGWELALPLIFQSMSTPSPLGKQVLSGWKLWQVGPQKLLPWKTAWLPSWIERPFHAQEGTMNPPPSSCTAIQWVPGPRTGAPAMGTASFG